MKGVIEKGLVNSSLDEMALISPPLVGILLAPGYPYYGNHSGLIVYGIYYPMLPHPNTPQSTIS